MTSEYKAERMLVAGYVRLFERLPSNTLASTLFVCIPLLTRKQRSTVIAVINREVRRVKESEAK